jgi:hypothetical protein
MRDWQVVEELIIPGTPVRLAMRELIADLD